MYSIDLVKNRRNLLLHGDHKFSVYSCLDNISPFDGRVGNGFYYVETQNCFPFRGNGFYHGSMVRGALQEELIHLSDIKYQMKSSLTLKDDYFHMIVTHLLEVFQDNIAMQKLSVNALIGLFGRQDTSYFESKIVDNHNLSDVENAYTELYNPVKCPINDEFSIISSKIQQEKLESTYPIYAQILDEEAWELYQLWKMMKSKGGIPLSLKTDCVVFLAKKPIDIQPFFWDKEKTIPKYKYEETPYPAKINVHVFHSKSFELPPNEFHTLQDDLTFDYNISIAKYILDSGKGCF